MTLVIISSHSQRMI